MKRQLYEGGGIMSLSKEGIGGGSIKGVDMGSRTGFFNPVKAAKKFVKKATGAVKDIAKSPIGKAALLYAGTAGLGSLGAGKGFGSLLKGSTYLPSTVASNLGTALFGTGAITDTGTGTKGILGKFGITPGFGVKEFASQSMKGNLGKLATLGAVSAFLTSQFGMTEEEAEEELTRNPSPYLERYYRNLNPRATDKQVAEFVAANTSEYAEGGRIMRAEGDTASDNAMQAAGIEGLPIRQNPKGVKELDLRDSGGFIPPVGIKEKEDDIPAMLSNNEFVFTADAVRGMGDGDVDLGAQRMYDMMKQLEAGGRV